MTWPDDAPKKIACVGGSVTWGYWLDYPILRKTYPDQLQRLLGPGYQVRNFGVGGATAGRYPGQDSRAYIYTGEEVGTVQWQPDTIIAGLGINDCIPTWADPQKFEQGYRDLVAAWRGGGRNPAIWMWTRLGPDFRGPLGVPGFPGNVFGPKYVFTENDDGMAANRPAIQAKMDLLAPDLGIGTIDVYSELAILPQWGGEGLHLVEPGLKRMAELIYCRSFPALATADTPMLSEVAPTPGSGSPKDETNTRYPWLELYNPHSHGICLDGLALDAGPDTPRFEFTKSTVLWPGERRIIFISGKNAQEPALNLHTNFTIEGAEGQVRLISRTNTTLDAIGWKNWTASGSLGRADNLNTTAVNSAAAHQRLVTTSPPDGWNNLDFDTTDWTSGTGGTGSELPVRTESQFAKRWSCDTPSTPSWSVLSSGGSWSQQSPGIMAAVGNGPSCSVSSWVQGTDKSWTTEVRLKLNGTSNLANPGFVIRGGTQPVGGGYGCLYINSNQTLFGFPNTSGFTLSNEANNDDFHVFRVAYYAPTRRFFVWRDGVEISGVTGGLYKDSSRFNWLTIGAVASSQAMDFAMDYASYDTTGAYAPQATNVYAATASPDTMPFTTDPTPPIPADGSTTCLVRIPFNGTGSTAVAGMKLNVQFDDGFRAWINGVEVASCNAPASGLVAPASREDSRGLDTVTLDLSAFANLINPGANVLALQAFNASDNDNRCFIRGTLDLVAPPQTQARYFSPPAAGAANGAGANLPGQGWLMTDPTPPAGGGVPLSLVLDTDGDGRSNLLEYSQGTNPAVADSAPALEAIDGLISFTWRDNSEVGWRLMESTDQIVWRPAVTSGPPDITASATAGMLNVSQPVVVGPGKTYRLAAIEQPNTSTWRARYFTPAEITASVLTQPDADPDSDGLPNYLEFALNSNPRSGAPSVFHPSANGHAIDVPDVGADRGVSWFLESTTDLSQWQQIANPDVRCLIDPVTGIYMLELADPELTADVGFLRVEFPPTGL